jgi:hypothetical protein
MNAMVSGSPTTTEPPDRTQRAAMNQAHLAIGMGTAQMRRTFHLQEISE